MSVRFRTLGAVASGLLAAATFVVAGPASAAPAVPTASGLSTAVTGHLTGTVSSPGAPYVWLGLDYIAGDVKLAVDAGSAAFDLETWGYAGPTPLYAQACTTPDRTEATCSLRTKIATVTPLDIAPSVTWSSDDTLGPQQRPTITVHDTGGGYLRAFVGLDGGSPLNPDGTSELLVTDTETVHVKRCGYNGAGEHCVLFTPDIAHTYMAKQHLQVTFGSMATITPTRPSATLTLDTDATGTYDLAWSLTNGVTGQAIPGVGGSVTDQPLDSKGAITPIDIPGAQLTDGTYGVATRMTVRDPDYGTFESATSWASAPGFRVDRTGPTVSDPKITRTKIYPAVNRSGRPGTTEISVAYGAKDLYGFTLRSNGPVVRVVGAGGIGRQAGVWNGKDKNGAFVPTGVYTVGTVDSVGNAGPDIGTITVDGRKLVMKTVRRTFTAQSTLIDKFVGKCSTLRKPSLHGWKGSLGLYSNTKCKKGGSAGGMATVHGVTIGRYDYIESFHVATYSGGAPGRGQRSAYIRFLSNAGYWKGEQLLSSKLGTHDASPYDPANYVKNGELIWGIAVRPGARYDVKSFTVTITYSVVQ